MSDDYDYDIDEYAAEGEEIMNEFDIYQRTAVGTLSLSTEDKFLTQVSIICNNNKDKLGLSDSNITSMITKSDMFKQKDYLNPLGYIFGYIATNGGNNMTVPDIKRTFNLISQIDEGIITETDIVRYARLWMFTTGKLKD